MVEIIKLMVMGALTLGSYWGFMHYVLGFQYWNMIPMDRKIEVGFVIPSKLEIKLQDLNGNGKNETLMAYDGKTYLLKLDEQGNPKIQAYKIAPALFGSMALPKE